MGFRDFGGGSFVDGSAPPRCIVYFGEQIVCIRIRFTLPIYRKCTEPVDTIRIIKAAEALNPKP